MTCRDLVAFLMEYLDGDLSESERARFDQHLAICPGCVTYLETYKETIRLGKRALDPSDEPVPAQVPEDLVKAILAARRQGN